MKSKFVIAAEPPHGRLQSRRQVGGTGTVTCVPYWHPRAGFHHERAPNGWRCSRGRLAWGGFLFGACSDFFWTLSDNRSHSRRRRRPSSSKPSSTSLR